MYESCQEKQERVKALFAGCSDESKRYEKIIELGRKSSPLPPEAKTEANEVHGCQSRMYLQTTSKGGKVFFETESDALISAGLAVLLTMVYSGETPEAIIKCPPDYLEELGISASVTPSRANGLYSIHLRMKQEALKILLAAR